MTPLVIIITIVGYFGLLLLISYLSNRGRGKDSDNTSFFTGGRRTPWPLVAFAMIGAAISGVTFISVPGMVVNKGYSYLQMVLGFIVGYGLVALVLVPAFYKRRLLSIYGYLGERFGRATYRSGAWFFFISKMLGAAVRFFVVCAVLQVLVFDPLHVPFELTVIVTIALIWLYTLQGGVRTLIWTDTLKSFCLITSVVLCIWFVAQALGMDWGGTMAAIGEHHTSKVFFFDDPRSASYFWKQFIAGIFMAIATNGLDQDMMQRNMACADPRSSAKNMIVSGVVQFFVIALFLVLGTLLVLFMESRRLPVPAKTDELFGLVATHPDVPVVVGILFILGLISAAYSAAGSALTSLTTSFTVDILGAHEKGTPERQRKVRKLVHLGMSLGMGVVIVVFYYLSNDDAISAVYTLASYTYGPILGLFAYGFITRHAVYDRLVPLVCVLAPCLSWCTQWLLHRYAGYETGFELLLINAAYTVLGLWILSFFGHRTAAVPES